MRCTSPFPNSILFTVTLTAAIALPVLLATVPARAQSPVPATAREAAASPVFAAKLHPVTRPTTNKPQVSARARAGRPSPQDQVLYENGPANGTTDAWTINFGYVVSNTFVPNATTLIGFDLYVWEYPGDSMSSLDWSITSAPNGGTIYGSGTVSGGNLTDRFISTNQYGYDIDKISATGLNVNVTSGSTYWVNLFNAGVPSGDPVYWDENSGSGCKSNGCPSQAVESALGTIPSEAFDIVGSSPPPPPPPSSCFGSGGSMQIIHEFSGGEGTPEGVAVDEAQNLYGISSGGAGYGMVYVLSPEGQGWVSNPVYSFAGGFKGSGPSPVIIGADKALYGTAGGGMDKLGLVFSLRRPPTACLTALCSWMETVLYPAPGNKGISNPGSLVSDQAGNLYGTSGGGAYGRGAVFELTPSNGGWTEKILYSFSGGSDGSGPGILLAGNDGNLYGTFSGGVFQLAPSGGGWIEKSIWTGGQAWPLVQDPSGTLYSSGLARDQNGCFVAIVFALTPSNGSWQYRVVYQSPPDCSVDLISITDMAADTLGNVFFVVTQVHACRGSDCSAPADNYHDWSEIFFKDSAGYVHAIWYSGQDVIFWPWGPMAIDANGHLYGTTTPCYPDHPFGTVWMLQ